MIQFAIVCLVIVMFILNHLIIRMWKEIFNDNIGDEFIVIGLILSCIYIFLNIWIVNLIITWGSVLLIVHGPIK